ncbi:MAG: hypothetical protein DMF06_17465 [Verrucomicrobia bacterium]|nr:MAG: hypothetical protein DMF06_17465 [Verrucomicrobiota bacterium]
MGWVQKVVASIGGRKSQIDDNRKLTRLGRDEYRYCEGDHAVILQIEMLRGTPSRLIYSSTIRQWLPPYQQEEISDTKRGEIAETIRIFLESCGESVVVQ